MTLFKEGSFDPFGVVRQALACMPADPKRLIECEVNSRLIFRSVNAERFAPGPTALLYPTRLEYKTATVFFGLADEAGRSGISRYLSDRDFMGIP